ncbi:MAG TPA: ubiquitin-activating E1 FCCH domain-containing protein [Caulobacterales bacterium]|nr:ubiquitin-activating E1 FCCH domain-containing protein [Caulobacterales bacterium]
MLWGLTASVLVGMAGLSVDFTRAQAIRSEIQNAADGAALAAARATGVTSDQREAAARAFFNAEAPDYANSVDFHLSPQGTNGYRVTASVPMSGSLTRLISQHDWTVSVKSDAERGGVNLEISLVLDTTQSMSGQKIADLRSAATDFVNTVVNDVQTPYYTKVAIVPFSSGVNVGSTYINTVRGTTTPGKSLTSATWFNGSQLTISAITRANPAVVTTSSNHGYSTGDVVYFSGIKNSGMGSNLNGNHYTITKISNTQFSLNSTNSSSWNSFSTSGSPRVQRCLLSTCEVQVTANSHGFANNAYVYITGVSGMTDLNNTAWQVKSAATNTFVLNGSDPSVGTTAGSGGTAYCTTTGCQYYRFTNVSGGTNIWQVSGTCVSERVGADKYSGVGPSSAYVGINYPASSSSGCSGAAILPLTSNKTSLTSRISSLSVANSTAGEIGAAWGWYMISPNWSSVWTGSSAPAAYGAPETSKIMVFMTDGQFNTAYCNGVISQDSSMISDSQRINCNGTNGSPSSSAQSICSAMKAQHITIFTIGFDMDSEPQSSRDVLTNCATDSSHAYLASTGQQLHAAFEAISTSISQLRITH